MMAKRTVETEVVMRQGFQDECSVMIIVGPINAIPPKSAITKQLKTTISCFISGKVEPISLRPNIPLYLLDFRN
jgi:hypothetical protein